MGAYQLKNEELTLTVISAGAEMKSLKDNKTEQEYLWQADPKFWGRTSPVLFPIVGNYVQKQSVYEGKHIRCHSMVLQETWNLIWRARQKKRFGLY